MKGVFLAGVSLVIFVACATREMEIVDDGDVFTVTIENIPQDVVDISECVDSLHQIVLETSKDILVGNVSQIIIQDDRIALLDRRTRSVHLFDIDGTFIRSFGRLGRGPGEYSDISKILFDKEKKQFMVYDGERRALLFYNVEGKYIKTIEGFGDYAPLRDVINLPSGGFLCSRFDRAGLTKKDDLVGVWETDSEGKFLRYLLHDEEQYPTIFTLGFYYLYNLPDGGVGYFDHNTYDIFFLKEDAFFRKIKFELPAEKVARDYKGQYASRDTKYAMPNNANHKGGYVFTAWSSTQGKPFVSLVSTKTQDVKTGLAFSNLIEGKLLGFSMIPNNSPRILTFVSPAELLLLMKTNDQLPEDYKKALEELLGDRTEEEVAQMNPVITLLYIKN